MMQGESLMECVITHTQDWLMLDMRGYQWHRTMTVSDPNDPGKASYDTTQIAILIGNELHRFDVDTSFDDVSKFVRNIN